MQESKKKQADNKIVVRSLPEYSPKERKKKIANIRKRLQENPNISEIVFKSCFFDEKGEDIISVLQFILEHPFSTLRLQSCSFTSSTLQLLCSGIAKNTTLLHLELHNNSILGSKGLPLTCLIELIKDNSLEALHLSCCIFTCEESEEIALLDELSDAIATAENLQWLSYSISPHVSGDFSDPDFEEALAKGIKDNTSLLKLEMNISRISLDAHNDIIKTLKTNGHMLSMRLTKGNMLWSNNELDKPYQDALTSNTTLIEFSSPLCIKSGYNALQLRRRKIALFNLMAIKPLLLEMLKQKNSWCWFIPKDVLLIIFHFCIADIQNNIWPIPSHNKREPLANEKDRNRLELPINQIFTPIDPNSIQLHFFTRLQSIYRKLSTHYACGSGLGILAKGGLYHIVSVYCDRLKLDASEKIVQDYWKEVINYELYFFEQCALNILNISHILPKRKRLIEKLKSLHLQKIANKIPDDVLEVKQDQVVLNSIKEKYAGIHISDNSTSVIEQINILFMLYANIVWENSNEDEVKFGAGIPDLMDAAVIYDQLQQQACNNLSHLVEYTPNHVWLEIFQYLHGSDIRQLYAVSKRFHQLIRQHLPFEKRVMPQVIDYVNHRFVLDYDYIPMPGIRLQPPGIHRYTFSPFGGVMQGAPPFSRDFYNKEMVEYLEKGKVTAPSQIVRHLCSRIVISLLPTPITDNSNDATDAVILRDLLYEAIWKTFNFSPNISQQLITRVSEDNHQSLTLLAQFKQILSGPKISTYRLYSLFLPNNGPKHQEKPAYIYTLFDVACFVGNEQVVSAILDLLQEFGEHIDNKEIIIPWITGAEDFYTYAASIPNSDWVLTQFEGRFPIDPDTGLKAALYSGGINNVKYILAKIIFRYIESKNIPLEKSSENEMNYLGHITQHIKGQVSTNMRYLQKSSPDAEVIKDFLCAVESGNEEQPFALNFHVEKWLEDADFLRILVGGLNTGGSLLHCALANDRHPEFIKYLYLKKPDVICLKTVSQQTVLHLLAKSEYCGRQNHHIIPPPFFLLTETFLEQAGNTNAIDNKGCAALHYTKNKISFFIVLIKNGAVLFTKSSEGKTGFGVYLETCKSNTRIMNLLPIQKLLTLIKIKDQIQLVQILRQTCRQSIENAINEFDRYEPRSLSRIHYRADKETAQQLRNSIQQNPYNIFAILHKHLSREAMGLRFYDKQPELRDHSLDTILITHFMNSAMMVNLFSCEQYIDHFQNKNEPHVFNSASDSLIQTLLGKSNLNLTRKFRREIRQQIITSFTRIIAIIIQPDSQQADKQHNAGLENDNNMPPPATF